MNKVVVFVLAIVLVAFGTGLAQTQSGQSTGTQSQSSGPAMRGQGQMAPGTSAQPGRQEGRMAAGESGWRKDSFKASKMIGATIKDPQGNKIGKVEDLMIIPQSQRAPFAVVSHDRKYSAIPLSALKEGTEKETFILNITKEQLAQAPTFDKNNWPNPTDRTWSSSVYKFYGVTPQWQESGSAQGKSGASPRPSGSTGMKPGSSQQSPGSSSR